MCATASTQLPPKLKFLYFRGLPSLLIGVGVVCSFTGIRSLIRAEASRRWPTAEGKVLTSAVEQYEYYDADRIGNRGRTYRADILYEYSVDGRLYTGDRIAHGDDDATSGSRAYRIVGRYPEGASVTVSYLPGDPDESLLEPGVRMQTLVLPGIGLASLGIGTLVLVSSYRKTHRPQVTQA